MEFAFLKMVLDRDREDEKASGTRQNFHPIGGQMLATDMTSAKATTVWIGRVLEQTSTAARVHFVTEEEHATSTSSAKVMKLVTFIATQLIKDVLTRKLQ